MVKIKLQPDFKDFLRFLNSRSVKYLLVGGYAVGFHGYPRATSDMDIWIAVDPENAKRIMAAFLDFGMDPSELSDDLFLEAGNIIRMGNPPICIEVLTKASGVDFAECYSRREIIETEGITVNVISYDDLIMNKRASGRLKDLADLENLP